MLGERRLQGSRQAVAPLELTGDDAYRHGPMDCLGCEVRGLESGADDDRGNDPVRNFLHEPPGKAAPRRETRRSEGSMDQFRVLRVRGELLEHVLQYLVIGHEVILRAQERETVQIHELAIPGLFVEVPRVAAETRTDHQNAADDWQAVRHNHSKLMVLYSVVVDRVFRSILRSGF